MTDSQTPLPLVEMLRALGWDVTTVYEYGIDKEKFDDRLVAWARSFDSVYVTLDLLRGETGVRVGREIRDRGGKVISILGGPDQPLERALGRLLFHYPEWHPFLEKHDGRVDIRDLKNCKLMPRSKMGGTIKKSSDPQFEDYLEAREEARIAARGRALGRKRRPKPTPKEQSNLNLGAGAA